MSAISEFCVCKGIDYNAGEVKNASHLKNRLLVRTNRDTQTEELNKTTCLGSYPIMAERHAFLSSSIGMITIEITAECPVKRLVLSG
jgi:hypothetical protein